MTRAPTSRRRAAPGAASGDPELVRRCLAGDQEAWAELVERYTGLVLSVALNRGLARPDAEEVLQSVYATLAERLHLIDDPACLPKWLMVTASRRAIQLARRSRRSGVPAEDLDREPAPGTDVEQRLVDAERESHVRAALAELPERDRELLRDLFERELPYAEIARKHGLRIGSLGSLRARSLARLRRLLEARGVLP